MVSPIVFFNSDYFTQFYNEHLKSKKGGGCDGLTPRTFWKRYQCELNDLAVRCLNGTYEFSPYREKLILKGRNRTPRVLSVPTMRDRLVLGVLNKYLQAVFPDAVSHEVPNQCINEVSQFMAEHASEPLWYFKTDIKSFFDELNLNLLYAKLEKKLDAYVFMLVKKAINTVTLADGEKRKNQSSLLRKRGVPQGLAISNILAGIYMQELDQAFKGSRSPVTLYKRYVDDIFILNNSEITEEFVNQFKVELILKCSTLRLSVDKTQYGKIGESNVPYIGYCIQTALSISILPKNVQKYLDRLSRLITRYRVQKENPSFRPRFISEDSEFETYYINKINQKMAGLKISNHLYGWMPYFQAATDMHLLYELDSIIHKKFLKGCDIEPNIVHLPIVYWDIKKHAGKHTLTDFDKIKDPTEMRTYLLKFGIINNGIAYSDDEIKNIFFAHLEHMKKDAHISIGTTY